MVALPKTVFNAERRRGALPMINTAGVAEHDPAHWRECADKARNEADKAVDTTTKEILIGIATAYERLASLAEVKLASER